MATSSHDSLREQVKVTDSALSFARALHELDRDDFDFLYFLEKPHKWQDDYELWLTRGAPTTDADPAWDGWANVQLQRQAAS